MHLLKWIHNLFCKGYIWLFTRRTDNIEAEVCGKACCGSKCTYGEYLWIRNCHFNYDDCAQ